MEFISLGGLVRGLSMEAIFMGVSQSRNPNLAAMFYRLQLVESYGTGIRKIMRLYSQESIHPEFRSAEGAFTVALPNTNQSTQSQPTTERANQSRDESSALFEFVKAKGTVTRKDVETEFGFGATKAYTLLKRLCEDGILLQQGQGNKTVYSVKAR